jgi:hypothetical protein
MKNPCLELNISRPFAYSRYLKSGDENFDSRFTGVQLEMKVVEVDHLSELKTIYYEDDQFSNWHDKELREIMPDKKIKL